MKLKKIFSPIKNPHWLSIDENNLSIFYVIVLTHRNIDFVILKKAFHLFKTHINRYAKEINFFLPSFCT